MKDEKQMDREEQLRQAKQRALHLLNTMGRTEAQLRDKLLQGGYPEEIVSEVLQYVKSFGYVNDANYARSFILGRKGRKSRRELWMQLEQKGVAGEVLEAAFEDCYGAEDTKKAIRELMAKRRYVPETAGPKDKQRLIRYLTQKGFCYEDIWEVLKEGAAI